MATMENAPWMRFMLSLMRSTIVVWRLRLMRLTISSVSIVVWKVTPLASSSSRSSRVLVRLPLWASAIWPKEE